jgi:hypothetical protein
LGNYSTTNYEILKVTHFCSREGTCNSFRELLKVIKKFPADKKLEICAWKIHKVTYFSSSKEAGNCNQRAIEAIHFDGIEEASHWF